MGNRLSSRPEVGVPKDQLLAPSEDDHQSMHEKSGPRWTPDHKVSRCGDGLSFASRHYPHNPCGVAFSLIIRRHHCRVCGLIFCDDCCPHRTVQTTGAKLEDDISRVRICHWCFTERIVNKASVDDGAKSARRLSQEDVVISKEPNGSLPEVLSNSMDNVKTRISFDDDRVAALTDQPDISKSPISSVPCNSPGPAVPIARLSMESSNNNNNNKLTIQKPGVVKMSDDMDMNNNFGSVVVKDGSEPTAAEVAQFVKGTPPHTPRSLSTEDESETAGIFQFIIRLFLLLTFLFANALFLRWLLTGGKDFALLSSPSSFVWTDSVRHFMDWCQDLSNHGMEKLTQIFNVSKK